MISFVIEYDNFTPGPAIEPCHRLPSTEFSMDEEDSVDDVVIRKETAISSMADATETAMQPTTEQPYSTFIYVHFR